LIFKSRRQDHVAGVVGHRHPVALLPVHRRSLRIRKQGIQNTPTIQSTAHPPQPPPLTQTPIVPTIPISVIPPASLRAVISADEQTAVLPTKPTPSTDPPALNALPETPARAGQATLEPLLDSVQPAPAQSSTALVLASRPGQSTESPALDTMDWDRLDLGLLPQAVRRDDALPEPSAMHGSEIGNGNGGDSFGGDEICFRSEEMDDEGGFGSGIGDYEVEPGPERPRTPYYPSTRSGSNQKFDPQ